MALSAFVMFYATFSVAIQLDIDHLVEWGFAVFRFGSAGFMIVYVEVWSSWGRLQPSCSQT